MERGEVLECLVARHDDAGLWVECDGVTGIVDTNAIAWKPADVPSVGEQVKVQVLFVTPEAEVPFDFVGSIKAAYPERHPIHRVDDSIIGTRFVSRTIPMGRWIVFRHPSGLPALLPREKLGRESVEYDDEIEAEVIGVNRERGWFLVRLPRMADSPPTRELGLSRDDIKGRS